MALRILVDEDLSPRIAQALWDLGFEAACIRDRGRLGRKDWELLPWLVQEGWTLCTDNGTEWANRVHGWCAAGNDHHGVLVVDQRWGTEGIIRALGLYLEREAPESLKNQVVIVDPGDGT